MSDKDDEMIPVEGADAFMTAVVNAAFKGTGAVIGTVDDEGNLHIENVDPKEMKKEPEVEVRQLPLPVGVERMETGVVQFSDDWPGIFLRGDMALHLARDLEEAASRLDFQDDRFLPATLRSFAALMEACNTANIDDDVR